MNKVILSGNVGSDAELRAFQSGDPYMTFTLATSKQWKDKDGQKQERTEWHAIKMFGSRTTSLAQHVTKGKKLCLFGELRTESWEKDGFKKQKTYVVCDELEFLGGGAREQTGNVPPKASDDDVPF